MRRLSSQAQAESGRASSVKIFWAQPVFLLCSATSSSRTPSLCFVSASTNFFVCPCLQPSAARLFYDERSGTNGSFPAQTHARTYAPPARLFDVLFVLIFVCCCCYCFFFCAGYFRYPFPARVWPGDPMRNPAHHEEQPQGNDGRFTSQLLH